MPIGRRLSAVGALLLGAALPKPAPAANWIEVGVANNGVKVLVDAGSLAAEKGQARIIQRFLFPKSGSHTLSRVDQQVVYGCSSRTVTTLRSVEYDRAGRVSRIHKAGASPPYRILPGTLPQYVFDLVC